MTRLIVSLFLVLVGCHKPDDGAAGPKSPTTGPSVGAPADPKPQAPGPGDELSEQWPMEGPAIKTEPTEYAKGGASKLSEIRVAIAEHDGQHINGWADVLSKEDTPPSEIHAALVELMNAVTGPSGIWVKVPDQWFGCASDAESEVCQSFGKLGTELKQWAAFQKKLERAPANPKRFLLKSHRTIMRYLAIYVPKGRNFEAVKATPLFQKHIKAAL